LATIANNGNGFFIVILDGDGLVDVLDITKAVDAYEGSNVGVVIVDPFEIIA
jgi:hypothetical protein